ncbi:MAG: CoA transferase [Ottowia sp.]|uniref:CaiB/BaiF CoA transferase family protein n=1 Tax=Ottowia sp. TaxID=1898956 RepID=UPI003C758A02
MAPLQDIVVIDFSKLIAGPLCTQYLGDMGASVIKIEDCLQGDDLRGMPPFVGDDGAMFYAMNRHKKSVALNLKSPEGLEIAKRLIQKADVLVESFGTGVADRLGIGPQAMRELNSRLVYCSVSGFGRTGPLRERAGLELMMQAFTGLMLTTGEANSGPLRIGFSPLDQTTGVHAVSAVLSGLRVRDKTGLGTYVEVSLLETAMGLMGWHAQTFWATGKAPVRPGSGHESLCPYQAFMASDDYLLLGIANDGLWRKFCRVSGLEEYGESPRFRTNAQRVLHWEETVTLVQGVISRKSVASWAEIFTEAGIPFSPINALEAALKNEQISARHLAMEYQHQTGGSMKAMAYPVRFEGMERQVRSPPPLHAEHTGEVLTDMLHMTHEQIGALADGGHLKLAANTADLSPSS